MRNMYILVFQIILTASCAVLAQTFGSEHDVASSECQMDAQVAYGDASYLVVWQDGYDTTDIIGAIVGKDGLSLNPDGIPVCVATGNQDRPSVAFSDGVFLVVWNDLRSGMDYDIYGTRVASDGTVLDTQGIAIASGLHNQCQPHLVAIPGGFMVAWSEFIGRGYTPRAVRISTNGLILDSQSIKITDLETVSPSANINDVEGVPCSKPRLAKIDSVLMLVWNGDIVRTLKGLYKTAGRQMLVDGTLLGSGPAIVYGEGQACGEPDIAAIDTSFYVVWGNGAGRGTNPAYNGIIKDAYGGNSTLVVFSDEKQVLSPATVAVGGRVLIVYKKYTGHVSQMLCRWLNADGTYSLPAELSAWAMHPAVAASPDSTGLVVYTQLPSGTSNSTRLVCRTVNATSTGVEKSSTATRSPLSLAISPNPLTGSATISFYAPTASNVSVYITNINGQKIRTINVGMPAKVNTRLNWDGLDGYGRTVVSGVYFCTLSAGDGEVRKKMLVLR